jgi:hypothetical protein
MSLNQGCLAPDMTEVSSGCYLSPTDKGALLTSDRNIIIIIIITDVAPAISV